MMETKKMYINGKWVHAADGSTVVDCSPYNGRPLATIANGGATDALKAIDAAAAAFPAWADLPPTQKRLLFLKAADILERRRDEVTLLLAEESGAARPFALFQATAGPNYLREAGSQVHRVIGQTLPAESAKLSMVLRQPVGVVAGIAPWNAPLVLGLRAVCFAMSYGNTLVLKPSEETPMSGGILLAEVFDEAGFPHGVLNVVTHGYGKSREIGDVLISDPRVRRLSFTGSTRVGRELAEKAGRYLKKISLELGGNDPLIILRDADIDYAVEVATFGRFLHQGQVCMNAKRLIVEKPVLNQFTRKFVSKVAKLKVGDPLAADTIIGPLINQRQVNAIHVQVTGALAEGARLLCGGAFEGLCYQPTVLTDVTEKMTLFDEETFGPVAPIICVTDSDEALRVANNSSYGLSAGILTKDIEKALCMAEKLETGSVHINEAPLHGETHAPLGGMKNSGWGRFGMEALEDFTELRWLTLQKGCRQYPF